MTRLSIDDQVSEMSPIPTGKLEDVLQHVTASLPPDRIVTRIVLNGKALPKYAESHALQTEVASIEELGIKTCDRKLWAAGGLDMAISAIERMHRSLVTAADRFRDEKIVDGSRYLVHCIEGLERFAEIIFVTRTAMELDFSKVAAEDRTLADVEKDFIAILRGILKAQEANDHEGIADGIEYGLLTNLRAWTDALQRLRRSQLSNA